MDGQAIISVAAVVVACTQFAKWAGVSDRQGPIAVLALSMLGVVIWGFSKGNYANAQLFDYFSGWITVAMSAAGIFGFTRSAGSSLTATKEPPAGAGASPTVKDTSWKAGL